MNIAENGAEIQAMIDNYFKSLTEEKIPLKITISGKRAVGKTMLIAKLKQFFEMQGCQIHIVSESDDPKYYPKAIKDNQNKKCRWDKWDITIEEKAPEVDIENISEECIDAYNRIKAFNTKD